jgi:hypothetical protein
MDKRPLQAHEIDERAAEARALLSSKVLADVFGELQDEYIQALIQVDVGTLTASTLHAKVKVLSEVQARLRSYQNDGAFKQLRRK